tara:strand:+ start:269 stop:481 length:213 start_codon:yes stop_codon:yes gene_type:complete
MAKQSKKEPTKKELKIMIYQMGERIMTLQMFLDSMSTEFGKYLLFKGDTVEFDKFKKKYEEKENKEKKDG